jgi:hypothetical protein
MDRREPLRVIEPLRLVPSTLSFFIILFVLHIFLVLPSFLQLERWDPICLETNTSLEYFYFVETVASACFGVASYDESNYKALYTGVEAKLELENQ